LSSTIRITSRAIVSLAGGGLGKVEERQGEKEKNQLTRETIALLVILIVELNRQNNALNSNTIQTHKNLSL
jgi:ABC-type methionine transport system permease subunit